MNRDRILIIEDDESVREMLEALLEESGYETHSVVDGPQGIEAAKSTLFHLSLIDLRLPGMGGLDVLREIRKIHSDAVCVVLTGFGTVELAVTAMKAGAFDFISKPFQVDLVLAIVKNGIEHHRLRQENLLLQKTVHEKYKFDNIIGKSATMQTVYELIEKVADSDSTVLIQGESGTGKEIIAKTIHFNSPRRDKPLVPVNCAAIPEALLESELFGHEKGAFTGATSSRMGRFEMAHGGTLFLDEISELPLPLQVKLLRVLQEREFERVGGTKSFRVDVRILAATNQDLEEAVAEKRFREDLFYRLHVIPITVPPLRSRSEDIPLLTDHFIKKFNKKKKRRLEGIDKETLEILVSYPWPGNIRELENLIERIATLKQEGLISKEDLPEKYTKQRSNRMIPLLDFPEEGVNFSEVVTQFENHLLEQALLKASGVKNRAAQLLHLNRTTLVEKLKKRGQMVH